MSDKFFQIKNADIAQDLLQHGFKMIDSHPITGWLLESPNDISITKSRKIVSITIKLYETAQQLNRTKRKYDLLVKEINLINQTRGK